jgi:hypothetical protein
MAGVPPCRICFRAAAGTPQRSASNSVPEFSRKFDEIGVLSPREPVTKITRTRDVLRDSFPAIQTRAKPSKGGDAKSPVYRATSLHDSGTAESSP